VLEYFSTRAEVVIVSKELCLQDQNFKDRLGFHTSYSFNGAVHSASSCHFLWVVQDGKDSVLETGFISVLNFLMETNYFCNFILKKSVKLIQEDMVSN